MPVCVYMWKWDLGMGGGRISNGVASSIGQGPGLVRRGHVCLILGVSLVSCMLNNVCWMNKWKDWVFSRPWEAIEAPLCWPRWEALRQSSTLSGTTLPQTMAPFIHEPSQLQRAPPGWLLPGQGEGSGNPEVQRRDSEGSGEVSVQAGLLICSWQKPTQIIFIT